MRVYLIGLGANSGHSLGANARVIAQSVGELRRRFGRLVMVSRFYATPAWPPGIGPDFVNAAAAVEAGLPPRRMLSLLHGIEDRMGRERPARWAPRSLDLDLLGCDGVVRPDPATLRRWMQLPLARQRQVAPEELILPHPRLQDRAFVLVPLADVAPEWRHPLTGRTVRTMRAALPARAGLAIRPVYTNYAVVKGAGGV